MKTESALEKRRAYATIWRDKNREKYNKYHRKIQYRYNPKLNAISREAYKLAGGYKVYREKTGDERLQLRRTAEARIFHKEANLREETEAEAWLRTIFPPQPSKREFEPSIRTIVRNEKTRNQSLRGDLLRIYHHECQVESCYETEVEVSHILAHHLEDSVDNDTNARLFCATHHRAYDGGRMIIEDNGEFVRFDHHGVFVQKGRIIYHDHHEINLTFEKKTREYHARKKQEMD